MEMLTSKWWRYMCQVEGEGGAGAWNRSCFFFLETPNIEKIIDCFPSKSGCKERCLKPIKDFFNI